MMLSSSSRKGPLAEAGFFGADDRSCPAPSRQRVRPRAGKILQKQGLRHRDFRPDAILLRTRDPLDLVITDFSSARLSDFDLEAVAPLQLNPLLRARGDRRNR